MNNINNDIDLIKSSLRGEKKAFNLLYHKYSKYHLLTCLRYVKQRFDAEDLLQESYIKIYKDLKQFNPQKGNFKSWSNRVVVNTCLQHLRKKRFVLEIENVTISEKLEISAQALTTLNLQDMTKVISDLPRGYRTVFNMYVIDGFSHKEIAEQLNVSVSTSKTQLMKAKKLLQDKLNRNDFSIAESYA